jgi:2-dehydro-3-deoxyphosphogluconate aldolase/(4S)-4-hydroxy-2-oxoglutarate aldolase
MIIAIIRGFEPDVCLRLSEAYVKGGIDMVEVTFNQKDPRSWKDTAAAIRSIKDHFAGSVKVGAGTVLTEEQLLMCEDAGGEYMVTPNVNTSLIRKCVADGLMAMPGAITPTEAVDAFNAGASYVKLFPAGVFGPEYVKALVAPLSHIPFLAVGGIGPHNIADFIKAGCVGAGVGGNLTNKEWISNGEWDKITAAAASLVLNSRI